MRKREKIKLKIRINSQCRVFDQSGGLPFSIVFGLSRRSPTDVDTRPILLDTSGSVLDVPFALANGLLKLYQGPNAEEVDLRSFQAPASKSQYLTLAAREEGQTHPWRNLHTHLCRIHVTSPLAKLLQSNTKYTIRLASEHLAVQWWAYGEPTALVSADGTPTQASESAAVLVSSKPSTGKAAFTTVSSLPWPPHVETRMQLHHIAAATHVVDISVENRGERAVCIQSSRRQRFLTRWGPFQPESIDEYRRRITSTVDDSGRSNFVITDAETGEVVHRYEPPACVPLTIPGADTRPKRHDITTLEPHLPFKKQIDVSDLLTTLSDGDYRMALGSLGAWWCWRTADEVFGAEERIPQASYVTQVPPLRLSCGDEILFRVEHGTCTTQN